MVKVVQQPLTHYQMCQQAQQRVLDRLKAFAEIQASGNPLTKAEVEKMMEKRPGVWGVLRGLGV